ncbi:patatin-like phospholipase family protein [Dokdonella sp.]|uniref:patatin-like phospholipase family protein n=1 Tax=Dokdonella sp. TaxID=2291710 RepID=UPI0025BFA17A|nr:patatin-like phospholipase family protein [Dokdonella sp.]MBX3689810.1 patatin-like phospholipase family protein [Dokdonella sp.]
MASDRTAFVLSGGGSLGAVQVGMLQALVEAGLMPDFVVGTSVGALNGAAFADDPTPKGVQRLADLWRSLRREDVFPLTLLAGLKALLLKRDHLVEAGALLSIVRGILHARRIEQTRIALHVTATDVLSGAEVTLSTGDLDTALMASTAIPVVFPHVEIDGRYLVDGGVGDNTPINTAVGLGATRIIVLPTGMSCGLREPPRDMAALALHIMSLQSMRQLDRDTERFAQRARITIVPPLCPLDVSVFDFSQTAALIDRTARQTRDWLAGGGMDQHGPLDVPLLHHHGHHA